MSSYLEGIIMLSGINLIAVLGLSLLTGFAGLFSFGHAGFMAIGAYSAAICTTLLKLPFSVGIAAGALVASGSSWLIGRATLRLKGDYFCIATLGFGEAIRLILDNFQGLGGSRGWPGIPASTTIWNILVLDVIGVVLLANLVRSRHGRNMIAVREEELAAQVAGINTFKYKMLALMVSAAYAGVAGALLAHYMTFIQPKMFSLVKSTELTIIVIFGGLGSISGSVLGAVVLTFLPELLRAVDKWRLVVYGLAVIGIMIGRPRGLMGGFELTPSAVRRWISDRKDMKTAKASQVAEDASAGKDGL
ncbi:MAG: branched-chain amino acid ABC transporter permease [Spirochaetae bacterium HGW-Spirochaetae-7]|jgi:branched-chain amino acid transport system permease protein|nr:MAG: branched-chain amino acid ABC transporter permease [Spirochaetae bacterium HGW-Spirochaetae-7]